MLSCFLFSYPQRKPTRAASPQNKICTDRREVTGEEYLLHAYTNCFHQLNSHSNFCNFKFKLNAKPEYSELQMTFLNHLASILEISHVNSSLIPTVHVALRKRTEDIFFNILLRQIAKESLLQLQFGRS